MPDGAGYGIAERLTERGGCGLDSKQQQAAWQARPKILAQDPQRKRMAGNAAAFHCRTVKEKELAWRTAEVHGIHEQNNVRLFSDDLLRVVLRRDAGIQAVRGNVFLQLPNHFWPRAVVAFQRVSNAHDAYTALELPLQGGGERLDGRVRRQGRSFWRTWDTRC